MEDNSAAGGTALVDSVVSAAIGDMGKDLGKRTAGGISAFIKKEFGRA